MTSVPTALILDFGGVLTTDLWDSVRACARREGLPDEALLDLLRDDPDIHRLFVQLEGGEVSQIEFEARLAAAAHVSPDGLLGRMCADLRPDEAMLAAVADDVDANLPPAKAMGMGVIHHVDTPETLAELERMFATTLLPIVDARR